MTKLFIPQIPNFLDTDGSPLEGGYVWIGSPNVSPQATQTTVYWDEDGTDIALQPIRTIGGRPARNGSPSKLFVPDEYSITVRNKNMEHIYTQLSENLFRIVPRIYADVADLQATAENRGVGALHQTDAGLRYEQVASGEHLTLNGIKLKMLPNEGRVTTEQFAMNLDGSTDDRSKLAALDDICLANGWSITLTGGTAYLATNLFIDSPIIWGGGKLKRAAGATVTLAGGLIAPKSASIFVTSHITPVEGIAINSSGVIRHQFDLGSGQFVISGPAHLGWFIETATTEDQSGAMRELAGSTSDTKHFDVACTFTNGYFGEGLNVISEKLTQKTATKTYASSAGSPETNYWGESKEFLMRPLNGLEFCEIEFTGAGEMDCNASASFDVSDDFTAYRSGGSLSNPPVVNLVSNSGINVAVDASPSGLWAAPTKGTIIRNPYIHNVIRNCIITTRAPFVQIIAPTVGNSYLDHLIYQDDNGDGRIDRPRLFGFWSGSAMATSVGAIAGLDIRDDIAANPVTGLTCQSIWNRRGDSPLHGELLNPQVQMKFATLRTAGFLDGSDAGRSFIRDTGGNKTTIRGGYIQSTDTDDDEEFCIYSNSITTEGLIVDGTQFWDMPGKGHMVYSVNPITNIIIKNPVWDVRGAAASSAGYNMVCDDIGRVRIDAWRFTGGQGIGWRGLISAVDTSTLFISALDAPTFANTSGHQLLSLTGTVGPQCYVEKSRFRTARPDATLRDQVVFKDCAYGATMTEYSNQVLTYTFSGDGTKTAESGLVHACGDAEYYTTPTPLTVQARSAGLAIANMGTNQLELDVATAWPSGTNNVSYQVKIAISQRAL